MATLQSEVEKAFYLYDSGQSLELYRDVDGNVQVGIQGAIEKFAQPRTRSEMAQSPEVMAIDPMMGASGRPDPAYLEARASLPMEKQKEMFEREAFQAIGAPLGLSIATLMTLPDLISLPPLIAAGMITAEEGKKFENVLNMLKYVPSAQVGEFLKEQGKNLGFSDAQVEAFGEGYLGGELSSIVVNAVPGAKQLVKGAKWLKDSAVDYAAGAEGRIADRGTRLMSGLDPQAAVDEIIAGIRRATQTRKRNKLVSFIEGNPDGFTIDLGGTPTPAQGFVVAPIKQTEIFIDSKELTPDALDALVDNVVALTQASGGKVYAGGWFDEKTGRYVLDAVQVVDDKNDALYLAAAGEQDAIWDLGELNVIRTEDGLTELKQSNTFDGGRYDEQRANQAKLVEGFTGSRVPDEAATAATGTARAAEELGTPQETNIVSTRLPTSKDAPEDALATRLQVGIESSKADPKTYEKNANLVKAYPNVRAVGDDPEVISQELIEHAKQNLLYLFDSVPDATRQRSKLWYEGARKITDDLSSQYSIPDRSVAAVMAVLSPQRDWFMNVSLGKRVLQIHIEKANEPWTNEMATKAGQIFGKEKYAPILQGISGKSYAELETVGEKAMWLRIYDETYNPRSHEIVTPEGGFLSTRLTGKGEEAGTAWGSLDQIAKAISVIEDSSIQNISNRLGNQHKVRNFYNNIFAPMDEAGDVTIDTHAVAAALLRPLSGNSIEVSHNFGTKAKGSNVPGGANNSVAGSNGTYGLYAEAYRQAAKERGVLPREMQSITWEAVRGLFSPSYKGQDTNIQYIDNIWNQYKVGDISLEEARDAVFKHAGGIDAPEWERSAGSVAAKVQDAGDAGKLSGASAPRKKSSGSGRGRNRRTTRPNQTKSVNTGSPDSVPGGDQ